MHSVTAFCSIYDIIAEPIVRHFAHLPLFAWRYAGFAAGTSLLYHSHAGCSPRHIDIVLTPVAHYIILTSFLHHFPIVAPLSLDIPAIACYAVPGKANGAEKAYRVEAGI
jgi:hypothetical protein